MHQRRVGRPTPLKVTSHAALASDLRFGYRALLRRPGSTTLFLVAFGLGMGLATIPVRVKRPCDPGVIGELVVDSGV